MIHSAVESTFTIIEFRNLLTRQVLKVSDRVVWSAIQTDLQPSVSLVTSAA